MAIPFSMAVSNTLLAAVVLPLMLAGCTTSDTQDTTQVTTPDNTVSLPEPSSPITDNETEPHTYAPFFTYPYEAGPEIQPAMGGTLVMQDGCLLLQSGERFTVPIFPHGITTWNEKTQTLTANGVAIALNTELFTNGPLGGGKYDPERDYDFEQQGNPNCLKDRYIEFLGSQFMDISK